MNTYSPLHSFTDPTKTSAAHALHFNLASYSLGELDTGVLEVTIGLRAPQGQTFRIVLPQIPAYLSVALPTLPEFGAPWPTSRIRTLKSTTRQKIRGISRGLMSGDNAGNTAVNQHQLNFICMESRKVSPDWKSIRRSCRSHCARANCSSGTLRNVNAHLAWVLNKSTLFTPKGIWSWKTMSGFASWFLLWLNVGDVMWWCKVPFDVHWVLQPFKYAAFFACVKAHMEYIHVEPTRAIECQYKPHLFASFYHEPPLVWKEVFFFTDSASTFLLTSGFSRIVSWTGH